MGLAWAHWQPANMFCGPPPPPLPLPHPGASRVASHPVHTLCRASGLTWRKERSRGGRWAERGGARRRAPSGRRQSSPGGRARSQRLFYRCRGNGSLRTRAQLPPPLIAHPLRVRSPGPAQGS